MLQVYLDIDCFWSLQSIRGSVTIEIFLFFKTISPRTVFREEILSMCDGCSLQRCC